MELSSNLLKGVFLIVLTIIGTTVENTFSCQTLKVLHTNMFAKQIIIFCLIYFTIDFAAEEFCFIKSANNKYSSLLGSDLRHAMPISRLTFSPEKCRNCN